MARVYHRDSNGRFASGGGGGSGGGKSGGGRAKAAPKTARGSKAAATRKANKATDERLLGKGLRGVGHRLTSKNRSLYAGSRSTKARNTELWTNVSDMQRRGAHGEKGAQRSTAKPKGTISRKR